MIRYNVLDALALEVEGDPAAGTVANLVTNVDGKLGAWGWLSPVPDTRVDPIGLSDGLRLVTDLAQPAHFLTEPQQVTPGATHTKAKFRNIGASTNTGVKGRIVFYDADLTQIGQTAQTLSDFAPSAIGQSTGTVALLAGTVYVALRLDLNDSGNEAGVDAGDYARIIDAGLWVGTLAEVNATTVTATSWVSILGPTHAIVIEREELNLGTLQANIADADLDPSTAPTIRKGKRVRLRSGIIDDDNVSIFAGRIRDATVRYDLLEPDATRRARITLTAVDPTAQLASITRPDGVATVDALAHVLEGTGVAWNINGTTGHAAGGMVAVSTNAGASALDQVGLTRDSNHAAAWVDRQGQLHVYDADQLPTTPAFTLDEEVYNADVEVDYSTERCINYVNLKVLRLDPVTGETQEVDHGPYTDELSRREWGTHEATFTVHGLAEDEATLTGFATAILDANAIPTRRLTSATITLDDVDDVAAYAGADLYDLVNVVNAAAGIATLDRIVRVRHTITAARWDLALGFAADGGVAIPQAIPSPPPANVLTLAQLLRPVGEVTAMMGLPSQVWPGWLLLNGAALVPGAYPELEEWLADAGLPTDVLPDLTDRIPVGAGVKALGAKTGEWTKTLTEAQLPPHTHGAGSLAAASGGGHTHGINRKTGTGSSTGVARGSATADTGALTDPDGTHAHNVTGSTGNGAGTASPVDITPRVFALYWVIRAKSGA